MIYYTFDYETVSEKDISKKDMTSTLYAKHISTYPLFVTFNEVDSESEKLKKVYCYHLKFKTLNSPKVIKEYNRFVNHIKEGGEVVACNSGFDVSIWNANNKVQIKAEQASDALVMGQILNWGSSLKDIAKFALDSEKFSEGVYLTRLLSKPDNIDNIHKYKKEFKDYVAYGIQDTYLTTLITKKFYSIYKSLQATKEDKVVHSLITLNNSFGIDVDVELCKFIAELKDYVVNCNNKELNELTNNYLENNVIDPKYSTKGSKELIKEVESITQTQRITKFLKAFCEYPLSSISKTHIKGLKNYNNELGNKILKLRKSYAVAKIQKSTAILDRQVNGKIFDYVRYHGAMTGRFTSSGANLLNFAKPATKREYTTANIKKLISAGSKKIIKLLKTKEAVQSLAVDLIRKVLIPPKGKKFLVADYASVERRILCQLTNHASAINNQRKGVDEYCIVASKYFNKKITKKNPVERGVGKLITLGGQYGAGVVALKKMFDEADIDITDEQVKKARDLFRETNVPIVKMWNQIKVKLVAYAEKGKNLQITTKSGRKLSYYKLGIEKRTHKEWGEYNVVTHNTPRGRMVLLAGEVTSHIIQSIARDLLIYHMSELAKAGYNTVLAPHDEFVIPISDDKQEETEIVKILNTLPKWIDYYHGIEYSIVDAYCK